MKTFNKQNVITDIKYEGLRDVFFMFFKEENGMAKQYSSSPRSRFVHNLKCHTGDNFINLLVQGKNAPTKRVYLQKIPFSFTNRIQPSSELEVTPKKCLLQYDNKMNVKLLAQKLRWNVDEIDLRSRKAEIFNCIYAGCPIFFNRTG